MHCWELLWHATRLEFSRHHYYHIIYLNLIFKWVGQMLQLRAIMKRSPNVSEIKHEENLMFIEYLLYSSIFLYMKWFILIMSCATDSPLGEYLLCFLYHCFRKPQLFVIWLWKSFLYVLCYNTSAMAPSGSTFNWFKIAIHDRMRESNEKSYISLGNNAGAQTIKQLYISRKLSSVRNKNLAPSRLSPSR